LYRVDIELYLISHISAIATLPNKESVAFSFLEMLSFHKLYPDSIAGFERGRKGEGRRNEKNWRKR